MAVTLEDIAVRLDAIEKRLAEQQNEDAIAIPIKQVAKRLSISEDTAYAWAKAGYIPNIRKNGRVIVSLGALRRWADEEAEKGVIHQ